MELGQVKAFPYDPISAYKIEYIHGFSILISPEVLRHKQEAGELIHELDFQLGEIVRVMPYKPLSAIRKVQIWVEWNNRVNGAAEFHSSRKWLINNGYNPKKVGCVELSNVKNFINWSRDTQPWIVLHELAHAYQHFRLKNKQALIDATYKQAVDMKLYDSVDYISGTKKTAYAIKNQKEYFAELSESYFGRNDYYPYTRNELMVHDPKGYSLMVQVWGVLINN